MDKVMHCDILTPDEAVFSGEVTGVQVPGTEGRFEVLFNHAPIISTLTAGKIVLRTAEGNKEIEGDEGVIEVIKNKIIILLESTRGDEGDEQDEKQ